jgi:hypothetical protein
MKILKGLLGGAAAAFVLAAGAPAAAEIQVNINQTYCNGSCREGHNDTECICEANADENPFGGGPWKYWGCYEVKCCDTIWETYEDYCSGSPYSECYLSNGASCWTDENGFCAGVVAYPRNVDHYETLGRAPGRNASFANETGFWYHDCTLWGQSPWDDGGHYGIVWD